MEPLHPNPGGTVDPDDLVGRVEELQRLHEALSRGGAHVTGERRMGKTSLLAKLQSELEDAGRTVVRLSAETSDLDVFAGRLLRELRRHRLIRERLSRWEQDIQGEFKVGIGSTGITLKGAAKTRPTDIIELDLVELLSSVNSPGGSVLILDEITVLCNGLGSAAAIEFLGNLRAERQGAQPLTLVISGSIGLHHAITDTRVINDLWRVNVGPLTDISARELTERLLLGIGAQSSPVLVSEIVSAASGIPFYIQAVTDRLRGAANLSVDEIVERCIIENDWHTEHYVTRTDEYYGSEDGPLAREMLDEFTIAGAPGLDLPSLSLRLSARVEPAPTRDRLLGLLARLEKDHYLTRRGARDRMSSDLLTRIWRLHRRLV